MKSLAPTLRLNARRIRHGIRVALFLPFLMSSLLVPDALAAQGSSVRVETFAFKPNGTVRIDNSLGTTRVDVWEQTTVRVVAEKKSPPASPLGPSDLVLMGAGDNVVIECRQSAARSRIDLMVYVPVRSHLQLNGGSSPIEVSGPLSSAIVETTGGNINYQLPGGDDAKVVMNSAKGSVKSMVPLNVSERSGTRSLQGRTGSGTAPIFLSSQAGNITLTSGPPLSMTARATEQTPIKDNSQTLDGAGDVGQGSPNSAGDRTSAGDSSTRTSDTRHQRELEQNDDEWVRQQMPSSGASGANRNQGNWVDIGGTNRSDNSSLEQKSGPLHRPRQERNTSGGGSGFRVRIIPSTTPLGAREPDSSIYDQPDNGPRNGNSQDRVSGGSTAGKGQTDSTGRSPNYEPNVVFDDRPRPKAGVPQDEPPRHVSSARSRTADPPVLRRNNDFYSDAPETPNRAGNRGVDEDSDSIKLNASLVNLNVVVRDRSGKAIPNLKQEDFQVTENGQPQTVEFFAPSTAPFNLVLLLDLSGSIQDKLDIIKAAALKFVDVVGGQDKIAVVTFTHDVKVISQLTANKDLVKKRIQSIDKAISGTAFYEAMWFALKDTLRGTEGQRNAIVVLTDGVDSSLDRYNPAPTRVTFDRLASRLEESDVMVFPIYLDTEYEEVFERQQSSTEAYAIARAQLERISEVTGGQVFPAEEAKDLAGIYKQVAAALRTVYSVGYYPTNSERDGTFRRVRVGVDRSDVAVRTRKGYFAK
jgi:VWFA-related protein